MTRDQWRESLILRVTKQPVSQPAQPRHAGSTAHNGTPQQGTLFGLEAARGALGALQHVPEVNLERGCHPEHGVEAGIAHPPLDVADHLLRKAAPLRHCIHRKSALLALGSKDLGHQGRDRGEVSLSQHAPTLS
jgi:hypothetical protein